MSLTHGFVRPHLPQGPRTATSFVEFVPVSIAKVRKLLEQQNPTKATGSDGIPSLQPFFELMQMFLRRYCQ